MRNFKGLVGFVVLGFLSQVATATVVPGRWEKVEALSEGAEISVVLKSGEKLECRFVAVTDNGLSVRRQDESKLDIPKAEVAEVVRNKGRSKKPMWIGLAAGAGGGAGIGAAVVSGMDETILARGDIMIPLLAGAGAAIGALIGQSVADQEFELLYTSLRP